MRKHRPTKVFGAPAGWSSAASVSGLVGVAVLVCLSIGCGRKATEGDCALILDRNVEVQMKQMKVTDPVAIEKRKNEIRAEMKEQLKDCVGKHVTDTLVACVSKAQTADEIDACMR